MQTPLPPKKDVALALLERSSVFVHLDPRKDGVVVPPSFKKQPRLVLQVGLNMAVPIRDLDFDDRGMSCTLSFNRTPFFCVVPWFSVFALVGEDGRGMVWPEDVPLELAQPPEKKEPALRAVPPPPASAPVLPPPRLQPSPKFSEGGPTPGPAKRPRPKKQPTETSDQAPTKLARRAKTKKAEPEAPSPVRASKKAKLEPAPQGETSSGRSDPEARPEPAPVRPSPVAPAPSPRAVPARPRAVPTRPRAVPTRPKAVPAPQASSSPQPAPQPAASPSSGSSPAPLRREPTREPPDKPGSKGKRELPPYLRVVK